MHGTLEFRVVTPVCGSKRRVTIEFMQTQSNFEIGEFQFNPSTGELTACGSDAVSSRLPPQPARLLKMLVERCPDVVTREEIQESLWPGIRADFEKNLHFCVRQVRSALGDSASQPRYVETIPRRGYRLIASVRELQNAKIIHDQPTESLLDGPSGDDRVASQSRMGLGGVGVGVTVVLVIVLFFAIRLGWLADVATPDIEKIRVAIMPFKTNKAGFEPMGNGEIGVDLLELFAADMNAIDLIGPTTTEDFLVQNISLKEMTQQIDVDFIVNGKFLPIDGRKRVLVEIIRARDGSHVWVKSFGPATTNREIATLTSQALRDQIGDFSHEDSQHR